MKRLAAKLFGLVLAMGSISQAAPGAVPDAHSWKGFGNGLAFQNFSAADQITPANVAGLKPVWNYSLPQHGGWEMTPLVVNGVLYGLDLEGNAFALDPETGKEIWKFTSGVRATNRGVSYWPGDAGHGARIIFPVADRLYALDPATGRPVAGFGGTGGFINIRDGFAQGDVAYRMTSPPTVYKNLIITGVSTQEFGSKGPSADPRAYDAITGKLVWRFHVIPQKGEANYGTWSGDIEGRSGPTTWGMMSVDEQTGTLFIPIGQPADNYVGTDRLGSNLYSDSIVALNANTGKYRWHYQTVHHDLWDFDLSAPPTLADLTVKGKRVPAVIEGTKMGFIFILDRRTGKPVFGVQERAVPQTTIPGERTAPTQPFPIKPEPLGRMGVSRADITTITPEANRYCTDMWNRMGFRDAPIFTPPSLTAPLLYSPTNAGGVGGVWGGVAFDPRTNMIYANVANMANYVYVRLDDGKKSSARGPSTGGYRTEEAFTKFMDPNGMPCIQPPWGEMVAINANTGDVTWRNTLGKAEIYGELGAHTGMINYAGSVATSGGLVFNAGITLICSQCKYDEPVIRAYDSKNGLQVWEGRLPAGSKSSPMTFVGKSGRQYVVITSSGRPNVDIAMVAFALPRPGEAAVDIHPAPPPKPQAAAPGAPAKVATAQPAAATADQLPAGPGKDQFASVCSGCHSITMATSAPRTHDGWINTIEDMRGRGAVMDDATEKTIADYLTTHYGSNASE